MKHLISEWFGNSVVVFKVLAIVAIPTALLLFHVWTQYKITEVGYEIAEVTTEHRQLLEENKKLTVEARVQSRSDRIAEVAGERFGLQEARPEQIITVNLNDDGAVHVQEHARLEESATHSAMQ